LVWPQRDGTSAALEPATPAPIMTMLSFKEMICNAPLILEK